MMNDVIMAFGENAVLVAVFCGALIAAVLCALILHDNMKRRQQVARMRQEYELDRDRHESSRNSRNMFIGKEEFTRNVQQQHRQNAAITEINKLRYMGGPNKYKEQLQDWSNWPSS
jgi:hypothetical protein